MRIFIALKNPSPQLGLNLRPLGPVASTLTATPLRRQNIGILNFPNLKVLLSVNEPVRNFPPMNISAVILIKPTNTHTFF
jgi:hypothetical protein